MQRLLGDPEDIAPSLVAYINGFSDTARAIFDCFNFGDQIEKLDASNRLFAIVKTMSEVDLTRTGRRTPTASPTCSRATCSSIW